MKNPKFELLWFIVPAVIAATYLTVYQNRQNDREAASGPDTQLVEQAPVASTDAPELAPADPAVDFPDAGELAPTTLEQDRAFIGRVFPLLSSWNLGDVKPLLSPVTVEAISDAELTEVMATLQARLGSLKYFDEPQPVPMEVDTATGAAQLELQQYQFIAYYEAGAAEVNLILERQPEPALYLFDIRIPN